MPRKPPARVVVITGAANGCGRALALEFALAGYSLVLGSRRESWLDTVRRDCEALHAMVIAQTTDLGSQREAYDLANLALARFKRVDVWINCVPLTLARENAAKSTISGDAELKSCEYAATAALECFELLGGGVLINVDAAAKGAMNTRASQQKSRDGVRETFDGIAKRATAVPGVRVTCLGSPHHTLSAETHAAMIVSLAKAISRPGLLGRVHGAVERERFRVQLRTAPRRTRRSGELPLLANTVQRDALAHDERMHAAASFSGGAQRMGAQREAAQASAAYERPERDSGSWRLASTISRRDQAAMVTLLLAVPAAIAALVLLAR